MDLGVALSELGAKISADFAAVKNSVENFHALQDAAANAIRVRDEARQAIVKTLDDMQAAIGEMRTKLDQDSHPVLAQVPAGT